MIVIEAEQGSAEWHQARAGVIMASMFKIVRSKVGLLDEKQQRYVNAIRSGFTVEGAKDAAGYKSRPTSSTIDRALAGEKIGEPSEGAKSYARRLALERICGAVLSDDFETWAMRRGREMEPDARRAHEIRAGVMVETCGLVLTGDRLFGASADGLIDDDGGAEYKCLVSPDEIYKVWADDISEYIDQVQGGMWLTGRVWWDFVMYCPALAPVGRDLYLRRIPRDDAYIEALESDLIDFNRLVEQYKREFLKEQ